MTITITWHTGRQSCQLPKSCLCGVGAQGRATQNLCLELHLTLQRAPDLELNLGLGNWQGIGIKEPILLY